MVAVPRHARGLDQPLFAQMPKVAGAWISRAAVVVAQITTGDHSKRANRRERSRFRPAEGVLAIAVANQLALWSTRQAQVACKRVPGLPIGLTTVAIAVRPTRIVVAASPVLIRPLPFVARTASERPCVIIIAVARARPRLAPVLITIAIARAAAASTARRVWLPLVVARIMVARVEVKHRDLRAVCCRRWRVRTVVV